MATPRRGAKATPPAGQRTATATPRAGQRTSASTVSAATAAGNRQRVARFILARGRLPTPGELGRIVKRK